MGAAAPTRAWSSPTSCTRAQAEQPAGGALAARRVLAQLPGQVPRDQRPAQADAPDVGRGRRRCRRARPRARRSTTSTRASRTTATGTACSAASTSATCGSRRTSTSSPPRTWPRPRPGTLDAAELRDLDMDGVDEVRLADDGPGRDGRPRRRRRHRRLGHPGGPPRAGGGACAAGPRPTTRRCASTTPAATPAAAEARAARRTAAPASIHDTVRVKEPGLAARLVYDAYERRSGLVRCPADRTRRREDWATARVTSSATRVDGAFEVVDLGPGRLVAARDDGVDRGRARSTGRRRRCTLGGDRRAPDARARRSTLEHRGGPPIDARARHRVDD